MNICPATEAKAAISELSLQANSKDKYPPFENPVTAQFHHRLLASITLIIIIIYSVLYIIRNPINLRILLLLFAIVCQFIIGIFTLLYSVPITLGAMHQFGGVLLFLSALWLLHSPKKNTF